MAAIPGRVLGQEGLDVWHVKMRAVAAGFLNREVGKEWCGSHWNVLRSVMKSLFEFDLRVVIGRKTTCRKPSILFLD